MKSILAPLVIAMAAFATSAHAQITPLPPMPTPLPGPVPTPIIMQPLTPVPYPSAAPAPALQPAQAAPAAAAAPAVAAAPAIRQWRGIYEGDGDATKRVFRNEVSWALFWNKLDRKEPAQLDEQQEMAVYISIGECSTGGYFPRVIDASVVDGKMVVTYSAGKPSENAIVTQVITHPWVVAIIPKTTLPVVFQEQ